MTSPKLPKMRKVNPYEGMTSDPDFAAAAKELGYTTVNKDHEVAAVKEHLLKGKLENERRDSTFAKAERQLYKEGILTTNDPFTDKKSWKDHYIQKEGLKGKKGRKAANQAYRDKVAEGGRNFMYADDTNTEWELQKIYDKMYDIESDKATRQYNKSLRKQAKEYMNQQTEAQERADERYAQQLEDQQAAQERMFEQQREMMDEMMNQPVYEPRQAAMPKIQAKPKTPKPINPAPAPPPQMSIPTAPAPEMVSLGNPNAIIKQSKTSSSRSRRRTRGTSTLTNR